MTGSGKTGLGIGLLEEAALDHIPAIAIDPKGDLGNLRLTFPELSAQDFRPWINSRQAADQGMSAAEHAKAEAAKWKNGLAEWGQGGERISRTAGIRAAVVRLRPPERWRTTSSSIASRGRAVTH